MPAKKNDFRSNLPEKKKNKKPPNASLKSLLIWSVIIVAFLYLLRLVSWPMETPVREIGYSQFYKDLLQNRVRTAEQSERIVRGEYVDGSKYTVTVPQDDSELTGLLREKAEYRVKLSSSTLILATGCSDTSWHFRPGFPLRRW